MSADFKISLKNGKKEITLPITVEYKDASNVDYKKELSPTLKLYSEADGQDSSSQMIGWVIVIVIVVGGLGIYIWRRKKKKK